MDEQVCFENIPSASFSKSPLKPYLVMQRIKNIGLTKFFQHSAEFNPFSKEDFKIAHPEFYVQNFYNGEGNFTTNSLPWSKKLVNSVGCTNKARIPPSAND